MGIHIASPQLIPLLDEADSFSIIQTCLRLVAENHIIKGYTADNANWLDLGRKENLIQVSATFHDAYFNRLIS
jgi:NDP-sugar pyrophosphorylase family protein